jgi:hypothetical protein
LAIITAFISSNAVDYFVIRVSVDERSEAPLVVMFL